MINHNQDAVTKLAAELIAINTTTREGVAAALKFLKTWAAQEKLVVTTFPQTEALLIETQPAAEKHISFVTHVDVVSAEQWKHAFQPEIKDGFLIGRGAVDDKGPLAVCLEVLKLSKDLANTNVSCLIITDEEEVNSDIGHVLNSGKFRPDFCLVADGGTHEILDVGQKGIIKHTLTTRTSGGHTAFEETHKSALLELLQCINQLETFGSNLEVAPEFKPALVNISSLVSESVAYSFPDQAIAHLEIQFPLPQTIEQWTTKLHEIEAEFPNTVVNIEWTCEPHTTAGSPWLKLFSFIPKLEFVTVGGVNLAKDLSLAGIPAVSHCPVTEYMGHCQNEKILLSDLQQGVDTYHRLVQEFTKTKI